MRLSTSQPQHQAGKMSPTPSSPALKQPHRTSSQDSHSDGIRKRVCKACDRCRLKKSKCDGSSPCSRCRADNAICVFGERKKSHDKVYPKGYVEMLEQQQSQLVQGLQEMYKRLQIARGWEGESLTESNGHPLTHDILAALNLLEAKHDGSGSFEAFEEDVSKLQSRLLADGRGFTPQRRGSMSSESEHSQHGAGRRTATGTPVLNQPNLFRESFHFDNLRNSNTASPLVESPAPLQQKQTQFVPPQRPNIATSTYQNDPSLYAPEWAQALSEAAHFQTRTMISPQQTHSPQQIDDIDLLDGQWAANGFDGMFSSGNSNNNNTNAVNVNSMLMMMGGLPQLTDLSNFQNIAAMDGMDVDFGKFVNPAATMEIYR